MSKRPNILFLFPDQWRPDYLGINEALPLRTPNLDRLCTQGMRFTNAVTPSPLCAPARASLANGRCYDRCGVINNGQPYPLEIPTFYQRLRDGGYRVAGVGKFDLDKPTLDWGQDGSRCLADWGFTDGVDNEGKFDGSRSYTAAGRPMGPYLKALAEGGVADAYAMEHRVCRATQGAYTTCVPEELYCDNWLSKNGLRFLRDLPAGQPWFLQVNFTGPHDPMDVTPRMRAPWAGVPFPKPHGNDHPDAHVVELVQQNYAAMCENIDRLIGEFLAAVEARGELNHTLVVFSSDHGEMLGDHNRRGKGTWRRASSGIPFVVAGPGVRPNTESPALVNLYDLAATFLDYAHSEALPQADARTLRPLLQGESQLHREVLVSGLNDWRLADDGQYKLVLGDGDSPLLFDRRDDPQEDRNIADHHPDAVERLTQAILHEQSLAP